MEPYILERPEHPISRREIDPRVLKVLYRLINAGHAAFLVGGGVRDLMLGRSPKDFDVGTSAHPHEVRALFRNSRLIGRRFRLVHVVFGPHNVEVATFRRPAEELPERAELLIRQDNTFGTPEEDAIRRDFTVNALFYDPRSFRVIDYVGGLADLRARLIRTVGDPERRMREDPVRMMRAVRFAAKLDFEIEPATRAAIERHREDLLKASVPRLVEETFRTLSTPAAARALVLTEQLGLLEVLLPRLSHHLRMCADPPQLTLTARNMATLGGAIDSGLAPSHALTLAALFLDLFFSPGDDSARRLVAAELVEDLRTRGFGRGDTEHMRLLLESFPRLLNPSRRTRSVVSRPYFAEARVLHQLTAAHYPGDPGALDRFLADQEGFLARVPAAAEGGLRRGRRNRRSRHRRRGRGAQPGANASQSSNGSSAEPDSISPPHLPPVERPD